MKALRSLTILLALAALVTACSSPSSSQNTEETERGAQLFTDNCQVCHGDAATGVGRIDAAPPHGPEGHTWHHADGQLLDIIMGRLDYPGRTMPSFADNLSEEEARAILTYFKLNWEEDQRAFQQEASQNWEDMNR